MGGRYTKDKDPARVLPSEPAYSGPSVTYKFVYTEVDMPAGIPRATTTTPVNAAPTQDHAYYQFLRAQYSEGYRLLTFCQIPGAKQVYSTGLNFKRSAQGIFYHQPETKGQFDLRMARSTLTPYRRGLAESNHKLWTDTVDVQRVIAGQTEVGGRLVCVFPGQQQEQQRPSETVTGAWTRVGVDLFFEVPSRPLSTTERYLSTCVSVPIQFYTSSSSSSNNNHNNNNNNYSTQYRVHGDIHLQHDWGGTMNSYLNRGWKLVDIFCDLGASRPGTHTTSGTLGSVWFFERLRSASGENLPVYEGRVIEHEVTIGQNISGNQVVMTWEPILEHLGSFGWELVCVVETPTKRRVGWKIKLKVLLFFQRTIVTQERRPPNHPVVYPVNPTPSNIHANNVKHSGHSGENVNPFQVDINQNSIPHHSNNINSLNIPGRTNHGNQTSEHGLQVEDGECSAVVVLEKNNHTAPTSNFKYPVFGPETIVYEAARSGSSQSEYEDRCSISSARNRNRRSTSGSIHRYPMFGRETVEYEAVRHATVLVESNYRGHYPQDGMYPSSMYGSVQNIHFGYRPRYGSTISRPFRRRPLLLREMKRSTFSL